MNTIKILLAEDDLFLRDIYREVLVDEGFIVTTAVDGEEALISLKQGGWDLVLLDDVMPKLTGVDVLKGIQTYKPRSLTKAIIFLTNIDNSEDMQFIKASVDSYIIKTNITPPQLVEKIKKLLGLA